MKKFSIKYVPLDFQHNLKKFQRIIFGEVYSDYICSDCGVIVTNLTQDYFNNDLVVLDYENFSCEEIQNNNIIKDIIE
jgi:hypothetical protein